MRHLKNIIIIIIFLVAVYFIFSIKTNSAVTNQSETTDISFVNRFYNKHGINISNEYINTSSFAPANDSLNKDFKFYFQDEKTIPKENDMIVWWTKNSPNGAPGHVGIIAEVEFSKGSNTGTVWTIEQGHGDQNLFSYKLIRNPDNTYHIIGFDNFEVKGWNHPLLSELQVEPTYK